MARKSPPPRAPKRITLNTKGVRAKYQRLDGFYMFEDVVYNGKPGFSAIIYRKDRITEGYLPAAE